MTIYDTLYKCRNCGELVVDYYHDQADVSTRLLVVCLAHTFKEHECKPGFISIADFVALGTVPREEK